MRKIVNLFLFMNLLALVGACSTPVVEQEISTAAPAPSKTVVALLESADREIAAGDHESAAADLERALRLEPKNARLWHHFSALRFKQGDWQQTINLAYKSNSLAAGNHALQAANWRLIAAAKQEMEDSEGAKQARRRADDLTR